MNWYIAKVMHKETLEAYLVASKAHNLSEARQQVEENLCQKCTHKKNGQTVPMEKIKSIMGIDRDRLEALHEEFPRDFQYLESSWCYVINWDQFFYEIGA